MENIDTCSCPGLTRFWSFLMVWKMPATAGVYYVVPTFPSYFLFYLQCSQRIPQLPQTLQVLLKTNCFGLKTVFCPLLQNSSATDRYILNMVNALAKLFSMYDNKLVFYQHVSIILWLPYNLVGKGHQNCGSKEENDKLVVVLCCSIKTTYSLKTVYGV